MSKHRSLIAGGTIPQSFLDALQEALGSYVSGNFSLSKVTDTQMRVVAGAGNDQVGLSIMGKYRYNTASVTATHPGGAAGTHDVYVTASDNAFTGAGVSEVDVTTYSFGLQIRTSGTPSTDLYRKVGTVVWTGTRIASFTQAVSGPGGTPPPQLFIQSTKPVAPNNGDRWIYTTRMWEFVSYGGLWNFVGGAPAHIEIDDSETLVTNVTWSNLATVGPSFPAPFPGAYQFEYGARWDTDAATEGWYVGPQVGMAVGDTDPFHQGAASSLHADASHGFSDTIGSKGVAALSGGDVLRLRYFRLNDAGAIPLHFSWRWIRVLPVSIPNDVLP